jgi:hypothetical protein
MSYWMKFGSASVTWVGSGMSYHPHIIQLLTNADDDWTGPSIVNLSVRVETHVFTPRVEIGDSKRINAGQIGVNLLTSGTAHAVMGGNGCQSGTSTCTYWADASSPSGYDNQTGWQPASPAFVNNTWHHIEFYAAMNSISSGVPQPNGIIKYWVDGNLVVNSTNVYLRTAQFATQKFNKLFLVPYIGPPGSPIAQDIWIDNLVVADQRMTSGTSPAPPTNLRVIQ